MMTWMSAASADVFYDLRLKAGHDALTAQRYLEAAESLRIACFGLLDTPKVLTPCLAMLSLAQNGLGRTADVDTTLGRIVEVETRFAVYDPSALDPELRTKFESLIVQRVAKSTLLGIPTLARIGSPEPAKRPAAAPSPDPRAPTPAPTRPVGHAAALDSVEYAKRLLADGKPAEAMPLLVNAVNRDPGKRDLRLLLLQASVLASDWQTAIAQLPMAQPFADSEPVAMFYAAVALFENGREAEARELMARAAPRLAPSPYVDAYAKKILGK